jgi:hypothetical protein
MFWKPYLIRAKVMDIIKKCHPERSEEYFKRFFAYAQNDKKFSTASPLLFYYTLNLKRITSPSLTT